MSRASLVAVTAAVALAVPAATAAEVPPAPTAPTRTDAWIARVVVPTVARARPGGGDVVAAVGARSRWTRGPTGLLVLGAQSDLSGRLWLRVRLPIRPNRSSGWIPADVTKLRRTQYRVEVSIRSRSVRLLYAGRVLRSYRAVVGRPYWPTPRGLFAVSERVREADPNGFLGPWALVLTAFSPTLMEFGGGPGQVALHGRGGASLADPLGSDRSHGCIRIPNVGIELLARVAREGTPVDVVA